MKNTYVWGALVAALINSGANASSLPGQTPNAESLALGGAALLLGTVSVVNDASMFKPITNTPKKDRAQKKDLPQKPDFAPAQNKHRKGFPHNQNSK
jgi:hypothetical protein